MTFRTTRSPRAEKSGHLIFAPKHSPSGSYIPGKCSPDLLSQRRKPAFWQPKHLLCENTDQLIFHTHFLLQCVFEQCELTFCETYAAWFFTFAGHSRSRFLWFRDSRSEVFFIASRMPDLTCGMSVRVSRMMLACKNEEGYRGKKYSVRSRFLPEHFLPVCSVLNRSGPPVFRKRGVGNREIFLSTRKDICKIVNILSM